MDNETVSLSLSLSPGTRHTCTSRTEYRLEASNQRSLSRGAARKKELAHRPRTSATFTSSVNVNPHSLVPFLNDADPMTALRW
eukprot:6043712-Pyramimonas_sp.AAC.1